jgi:hypothetical protein
MVTLLVTETEDLFDLKDLKSTRGEKHWNSMSWHVKSYSNKKCKDKLHKSFDFTQKKTQEISIEIIYMS